MFSRAEALYERTPDGLRIRPLAHMLADALQAPSETARQRGLQRLGDVSLFVAGFFARSFARKLIDVDYHIAMGGSAYSSLADTMPRSRSGRSVAAVYAQLARKFQRLVDALNEVSEMSYRHTDADILRLYEIWLKTGSRRAHGILGELGVRPVRERAACASRTDVRWCCAACIAARALYDVDRISTSTIFSSPIAAPSRRRAACAAGAPDEELLLAETPDGAGVALYFDPSVLRRLERADPARRAARR